MQWRIYARDATVGAPGAGLVCTGVRQSAQWCGICLLAPCCVLLAPHCLLLAPLRLATCCLLLATSERSACLHKRTRGNLCSSQGRDHPPQTCESGASGAVVSRTPGFPTRSRTTSTAMPLFSESWTVNVHVSCNVGCTLPLIYDCCFVSYLCCHSFISLCRYCDRIGRPHNRNNVMLTVDIAARVVYQTCWDPDCRGFQSAVSRSSSIPSISDHHLSYEAIMRVCVELNLVYFDTQARPVPPEALTEAEVRSQPPNLTSTRCIPVSKTGLF